MKRHLHGGIDRRQNDQQRSTVTSPWRGAFALLEIVVAVTVVVGIFGAASQPLGWASAMQLVLCTALGALLWLADVRLASDDSIDAERVDVFAYRHGAAPEATSSQR